MIDQAGFSLVELMIAMSLGLVLTAAVATLALNAAQSYRSLYLAGEQIENGRYALMTLKDDLEHAGYWGVFSPSSAKLTLPATMPDPCDHGPENLANHFFLPLTGTGFTCLEDLIGRIEGTDVLAIRRIESSAPDAAAIPQTLSTTRTYFQANPGDYIIATDCELVSGQVNCTSSWGLRGASPRFTLVQPDNSLANIREYHADLYYIRSWSTSPGDGIPALVRLAAARSDATPEAVIDGIQNMQILFGLDGVLTNETNCNNQSFRPSIGNGSPTAYYTAGQITCWKDWSNVVTVRIDLLARTLYQDSTYRDDKTYEIGTLSVPAPGDHYHRRVFSQVVRLVNVSGRRQ